MTWSREQIIWAAGVIEGEGHLGAVKQSHATTRQLRVTVSMTDLDIVERLQKVFGVGQINGPRLRGTNKPIFTWNVCNFSDAQAVMTAIYPWMGIRRREAILTSLMKNKIAREAAARKFCRRGLHDDLSDKGSQAGGAFCKPCKRASERNRLMAVS